MLLYSNYSTIWTIILHSDPKPKSVSGYTVKVTQKTPTTGSRFLRSISVTCKKAQEKLTEEQIIDDIVSCIEHEMFRDCGMCRNIMAAAKKCSFGALSPNVLWHHLNHFNLKIDEPDPKEHRVQGKHLALQFYGSNTPFCFYNPLGIHYRAFPTSDGEPGKSYYYYSVVNMINNDLLHNI